MPAITSIIAGVGAAAAVGSAGYSVHKGQMANKEVNRQKSISAEQQRIQGEAIAKEEAIASAEAKALQDEIIRKQRAANTEISATTLARKVRGRRSLISGSETGLNEEFKSTLG